MRCDRCGLPYDPLSYSPELSVSAKEEVPYKTEGINCTAGEVVRYSGIWWNEVHLCSACEADVREFIFGFKNAKKGETS